MNNKSLIGYAYSNNNHLKRHTKAEEYTAYTKYDRATFVLCGFIWGVLLAVSIAS